MYEQKSRLEERTYFDEVLDTEMEENFGLTRHEFETRKTSSVMNRILETYYSTYRHDFEDAITEILVGLEDRHGICLLLDSDGHITHGHHNDSSSVGGWIEERIPDDVEQDIIDEARNMCSIRNRWHVDVKFSYDRQCPISKTGTVSNLEDWCGDGIRALEME